MYKEYIVGCFVVVLLVIEQFLLIPKLYFRNRLRLFWFMSALLLLGFTAGEMFLILPNIRPRLSVIPIAPSKLLSTFTILVLCRNLGFYSFVFLIMNLRRELALSRKKALALKNQMQYIDVRNMQNEVVYIQVHDIMCCEQNQNMSYVFLATGEKYYRFNSMKDLEELLGEDLFVRISRQHLINKEYIDGYNSQYVFLGEIELEKGLVLPICKAKKESVMEILIQSNVAWRDYFLEDNKEYDCVSDMKKVGREKMNAVFEYIKAHPNCKVNQIATGTEFSKSTVERYLNKLKDMGFIEYQGNWKTGGYVMVSDKL